MAERTHMMKAANGIVDTAKMSAANSAGGNSIFFPLNEVIGGPANLVDVGATALGMLETTTGIRGKPDVFVGGVPAAGTVDHVLLETSGFIQFVLVDGSDAGLTPFFAQLAKFSVGAGINGIEIIAQTGICSLGNGAAALNTSAFALTNVQAINLIAFVGDKIGVDASEDSGTKVATTRYVSVWAMDDVDNVFYDTGARASADAFGTVTPANTIAIGNLGAFPNYCCGSKIFTAGLPSTWKADLKGMFNRATTIDADGEYKSKGMPASWVTL